MIRIYNHLYIENEEDYNNNISGKRGDRDFIEGNFICKPNRFPCWFKSNLPYDYHSCGNWCETNNLIELKKYIKKEKEFYEMVDKLI